MSKKMLDYVSHLTLVDMNPECIRYCRDMFSGDDRVSYFVNDGVSLPAVRDGSIDFVFSWDSFVHMQRYVIERYMAELWSKMKSGAIGAIHHSFLYAGNDEYSFDNIQGRSNFSPKLFELLCIKYGFELIDQKLFQFNDLRDVLSIFKRP